MIFFYITITAHKQEKKENLLMATSTTSLTRRLYQDIWENILVDIPEYIERDSFDVKYQCREVQFSQEWDFSDCVASTNENSLKVLSILDFAGQSAYYACHHIFFSPRAFYILVVDMSKNLKSHADRACDKEGLIYSDWTYAGIHIYTFN